MHLLLFKRTITYYVESVGWVFGWRECRHLIVCYGVLPGVRNDEDLLFWGEKHC